MLTVVIEIGDTYIRAGIAGESIPRVIETFDRGDCSKVFVMSYLNSLFIDKLQLKIKECRILLLESVLCEAVWRDLIYQCCLVDFQVSVCSLYCLDAPNTISVCKYFDTAQHLFSDSFYTIAHCPYRRYRF